MLQAWSPESAGKARWLSGVLFCATGDSLDPRSRVGNKYLS